tara:strand:- start:480 stop:1031 length:552 start_codon:yes stop_codon:yes gene_type:complete
MRLDGPIAGENFTSDTRNYPWHRPPDLVEYDEIVEYLLTTVSKKDTLPGVMSSLSIGNSIAAVTDYLILSSVGNGKFSIDMGLLVAGPLARYIQIMADKFSVEYEFGLEEEEHPISTDLARSLRPEPETETVANVEEEMNSEQEARAGFMSPLSSTEPTAPSDEQNQMLGVVDEQDVEETDDG